MAEAQATHAADHESGPRIESGRLGVWLFLGSEVLLFAGLIGSYLFLRTGSRDFPAPGDALGQVRGAWHARALARGDAAARRSVSGAAVA